MSRILIAIAIGITLLAFSSQSRAQTPSPQERSPLETNLVDVGGIATRYHAASLNKRTPGVPVIVFINGSLASMETWRGVLDRMDSNMPRLAYDRPGAGRSAPVEGKLTPERATAHLSAMLKQLEISPPFIFVSWSWGGPLALDFASRHPGTVVGNVFLDPTLIGTDPIVDRARLIRLGASLKDIDAADARGKLESREMLDSLPPGARSELEAIFEVADGLDLRYPRVPTTILLAGRYDQGFTRGSLPPRVDEAAYFRAERADLWQVLENRLRDVPGAVLRLLPKSSHKIPAEAPEAVAEEIGRVLGTLNK